MEINPRRQYFLKVLIDHFHPKSSKEFISIGCDKELAQSLLSLKAPPISLTELHIPTEEFLKKIHYSWIYNHIKKYPSPLHPIMIASLPKEHVQGISQFLNDETLLTKKIPKSTRKFFQNFLRKGLEPKNILDEIFLPQMPLSELLLLDKIILLEMIDLLGLYDLAIKMKVIIDRQLISKINSAFTEKKVQFLHAIINQKKKIPTYEFDLRAWDEDPESLKKMVHKRGLYKLSQALGGYSKDFLWHFSRKFDIGRGKILNDYYPKTTSSISLQLNEQIFFIINTLNPKSKS